MTFQILQSTVQIDELLTKLLGKTSNGRINGSFRIRDSLQMRTNKLVS